MKYIISAFLLLMTFVVKADYVNDGRHQFYGKIVYIDKNQVKLKINCTGEERIFKWTGIVGIAFDNQCKHPGSNFSTSAATADEKCPKKTIFSVQFNNLQGVSMADSVKLDEHGWYVHFINNQGDFNSTAANPSTTIQWITMDEKCLNDLNTTFPIPHK
ncbi:hypothetical protein [Chitinophaga sp. Cy-1792]|uniref:hypothetical protein n=1 Tax=Chitinophaga sp. Cy-1792 TaxID=2608339 RepID=UPI001422BACC|nr:hypothetical protein [Chitinophaga sp. Cy-1792]NIG56762.1 hypothetical protein [Chitinophaga sp. Cy-1792]